MIDTPEFSEEPQPKPKKLVDFLPAKVAVQTSLGTLYVRHAYTSDWKHFESDDSQELGRVAVRQLCSRFEDKSDSGPLAEVDLESLHDTDFHALAPVISKQSDWGEMPAGAGLMELGDAAKAAKEQWIRLNKEMLADLRRSIDSSYGFLGKSALEKLQEQMRGLANIRSAISGTEAQQAAMRASSLLGDALKGSLASSSASKTAMHGVHLGDTVRGIEAARTLKLPQIPMPPRPEDTRLGRATLESAENSREVALKMEALVDLIAGLNQTLIKDILPGWVKKVEDDQMGAKVAFNQAANGLRWTKWAVIASVVVTVLTTWWQVYVAREIDRENTDQQKRVEVVLSKQLAGQQKLIEQQARDATAMREAIAALKTQALVAAPKK